MGLILCELAFFKSPVPRLSTEKPSSNGIAMSSYSSPLLALVLAGFLALELISLTVPPRTDQNRMISAKFLTPRHQSTTMDKPNAFEPVFNRIYAVLGSVAAVVDVDAEGATAQDLPEAGDQTVAQ